MASVNAPASQNPTAKELTVHCQVVDYLMYNNLLFHHSPNEGKRSEHTGYILKRMGMSKGFPDIFIFEPNKFYHGLALELKREKGSKVSDAQREWIDSLNKKGYKAVICKGFDEARKAIDDYLRER